MLPETCYLKDHIFGTDWNEFLMVLVYRQKWYFEPPNFYLRTKKLNIYFVAFMSYIATLR